MASAPPLSAQQSAEPATVAAVPSWRERYVQGSFRGVVFVTESRDRSGGRRVALTELPFRDTPISEDMGRRAREYSLELFVHGRDYYDRRDALLAALEAFGPGTLIDPWGGAALSVVVEDYRLTETTEDGGIARFSVLFRESGAADPVRVTADTASQAASAADAITAAAPDEFAARFSVDKVAGFVEDAAAVIVDAAAITAEVSAALSGGLGPILRTFEAGLRLLPGGALLRAPLSLGHALVGLIGAVEALGSGPRTRMSALEPLAGFGASLPAVPRTTPARIRQADNQDALVHLVRVTAAAGLVRAAAATRWAGQNEAVLVRTRLGDLLDGHALAAADAGEDARAADFDTLRRALVRDLTARAATLARSYSYTPAQTEPALVIAQRLYGFGRDSRSDFGGDIATRADRLVQANGVRHPGFVTGGDVLQVAAYG